MLLELDARQEQDNQLDNDIINDLQPVKQPDPRKQSILTISIIAACVVLVASGLIYYLPTLKPSPIDPAAINQQTIIPVATKQKIAEKIPLIKQTTASSHSLNTENTRLSTSSKGKHQIQMINALSPATLRNDHNSHKKKASPTITLNTLSQQTTTASNTDASNNSPNTEKPIITIKSATSAVITNTLPAAIIKKSGRLFTSQQKTEIQYADALRFLKQGRPRESIELLYATIKSDPEHVKAREVLGSLLMQQLRWQDAEQVLTTGIELNPKHFNFNHLLARLKVEQGDNNLAIGILEESLLQGNSNADSSALLALLYQRQGRHADASQYYKLALNTQPNHGKWWLGLAISLEAQQAFGSAAKAYEFAATSKQLEPQLQQYAHQRRLAINRESRAR